MRRLLVLCAGLNLLGQPSLPPLREQAMTQQAWVKLRLERVLPGLMRKHDVSMWLVISREYNEDPVFFLVGLAADLRGAAADDLCIV